MNDGTDRVASGQKSVYQIADGFDTVSKGEVISIEDPTGMGRIKVRIKGAIVKGGDDSILDSDLPWCFPTLPKHLNVVPKLNEAVIIFHLDKTRPHIDRLYLGPIISQEQKLEYDPFYFTAWNGFSFANKKPNVAVDTIPELAGIFPNKEDISIQGRFNTDITQKNNEIIIRAGKFVEAPTSTSNPYPFKFNSTTQGFIQVKNDVVIVSGDTIQKGSVTNIVSNKINLITHANGSPRFNVTNQQNLISDEEMLNIINTAHQVPFGDVLIEYLRLLKDALFLHVHNGHGNVATDLTKAGNRQAIANLKAKADDLEKRMLSENVRIN